LLVAFLLLFANRKFRDDGYEGAFFMLMMILFSPVAWKHYWVMSFPAVFVLMESCSYGKKIKLSLALSGCSSF